MKNSSKFNNRTMPLPLRYSLIVSGMSFFMVSGVYATDAGDAPASYGVAQHEVSAGSPQLGLVAPDNDLVGLASDDNDGVDDEDGVFAFPTLVESSKAYTTNVFVTNPGAQDATLAGWVDFNGDGIFSPEESAIATVPAGAANERIKLIWQDLGGISSDFTGDTFARFRISTDLITPFDATGTFADGEVEDYQLSILPDADGDEISDAEDPDDDNDLIPDVVEGLDVDTDGDGLVDGLDTDSDNDLVPDFFEAGDDPTSPVDTDGDGTPDFRDLDSDGDSAPDSLLITSDLDNDGILGSFEGIGDADADGIINSFDIDSDNGGISDVIETTNDSDADCVPNFLDLDSDNDGVSDLIESSHGVFDAQLLDTDGDSRIDPGNIHGENGLADALETLPDSGTTVFLLADSDADGTPDFLDLDSDADGVGDLVEIAGTDTDNNLQVDALLDSDGDGIIDSVDLDLNPGGVDSDLDGIIDSADIDFVEDEDTDLDGIADASDPDLDGNGLIDQPVNFNSTNGVVPDSDGDGIPDSQDSVDGQNADDTNGNGANSTTDVNGIGETVSLNELSSGVPPGGVSIDGVTDIDGSIETGLNGVGAGGCSIYRAEGGSIDPVLSLMAGLAMLMLLFRRLSIAARLRYSYARQFLKI